MKNNINFRTDPIWINIDKPIGYSSAKTVAIVKRFTRAKKVGHGGTLDPFASGCLPIALNKATKTVNYVMNDKKKYFFTIIWGEFRDTDDLEGRVEQTSEKRPINQEIISVLPRFLGKILQTPSRFSAIKIDGSRAYELARKNEDFEIKKREIEIFSIKFLENCQTHANFEVECSKGTYVRSLSRAICEELKVCGYVSVLKRQKVGKFLIKNIISLEKLKRIVHNAVSFFDGELLSLQDVLDISKIEIDDLQSAKFKNGQIIEVKSELIESDLLGVVQVLNSGEIIGLGKLEQSSLKPINVF